MKGKFLKPLVTVGPLVHFSKVLWLVWHAFTLGKLCHKLSEWTDPIHKQMCEGKQGSCHSSPKPLSSTLPMHSPEHTESDHKTFLRASKKYRNGTQNSLFIFINHNSIVLSYHICHYVGFLYKTLACKYLRVTISLSDPDTHWFNVIKQPVVIALSCSNLACKSGPLPSAFIN